MNSLLEVIRKEQGPHLLAVCFDKGGSQERTAMFAEYKANRDETPEAIRLAIPYTLYPPNIGGHADSYYRKGRLRSR